MNKHNFLQFNPNRYKTHLSPFGQNVLETLIMHWRTGYNNAGRRQRQHLEESNRNTRESRNSSRHVSCSPTPARHDHYGTETETAHNSNNDNFSLPPNPRYQSKRAQKQTLYFYNEPDVPLNPPHAHNIPEDDLPAVTVPSVDELVKAVNVATANDDEILTANDMIAPIIDFTNEQNKKLIQSKQFNDNADIPARKFLEILNMDNNIDGIESSIDEVPKTKDDNIERYNVDWDNMFDTELFQDLNNPKQTMKPDEQNNENHLIIPILNDTVRTEKKVEKNKAFSIKAIDNKKTGKRNLDQTQITKTITKKVKKGCTSKEKNTEKVSKNSYRKVKYTKAVKSWLDDVDPSMKIEEEFTETSTKNKIHVENFPVVSITPEEVTGTDTIVAPLITEPPSINIDKKAKEKIRKVVQATLAQKDGKMKFKLPVKGQTESKAEAADDKQTKIQDVVKEKKTKTKFIAPIKSQVPVKSVQFDICTIDDENINRIKNVTDTESGNTDLIMVLVYTNGFCQLNNEHTDETCVPEGILIQINDSYFFVKGDIAAYGEIIKELIEKNHVICYNAKQLLIHIMSKFGIELMQGDFNISDAKIGASLIDPDSPPENFTELQKLLTFTPEYTIATDCVLQKSAWYSTLLKECFTKLKSLLIESSVWSVFVDIEMPLLPVIAGMEYQGVNVDLDKLKSMEEILLTKMKAVEQECYKAAGKTFQINSALQVRTILYDELQLDTKSNMKIKETIGKGAKSTSETMLRGLMSVHPLPRLILEYRHLHKAHATFLTGIAQHVKDGLVKPTWVQTAAATGRIASNNPNLQAIPKAPFSLVLFPDDADVQEAALNFRSVYTAREGHELLAADFKHIECRVFALCAGDASLLAALRSDDLFRVLAAQWLGVDAASVSAAQRARTKRVVYASLYGAGARRLADILQEPYDQANAVLASFHRTFPSLQQFARAAVARAARGALRSLAGRARRFPGLASADAARRAHAERQAVNFAVQASAADLCKKAMAATARRLRGAGLGGRLLLQIHDELVWELRPQQLRPAAAIIKETMEGVGRACGLAAALPVALSRGPSWGELRPLSLDH